MARNPSDHLHGLTSSPDLVQHYSWRTLEGPKYIGNTAKISPKEFLQKALKPFKRAECHSQILSHGFIRQGDKMGTRYFKIKYTNP